MILQLNPQIRVKTPLGMAWAYLIIDYGLDINTIWVVRLDKDGVVKHIESNDVQIDGNPMLKLPLLTQ